MPPNGKEKYFRNLKKLRKQTESLYKCFYDVEKLSLFRWNSLLKLLKSIELFFLGARDSFFGIHKL